MGAKVSLCLPLGLKHRAMTSGFAGKPYESEYAGGVKGTPPRKDASPWKSPIERAAPGCSNPEGPGDVVGVTSRPWWQGPWSEWLCVSEEKAWFLGAQELSVTKGDSIPPALPECQ